MATVFGTLAKIDIACMAQWSRWLQRFVRRKPCYFAIAAVLCFEKRVEVFERLIAN